MKAFHSRKNSPRRNFAKRVIPAALAGLASSQIVGVPAANITWLGNTNNSWNTSANWSNNATPVPHTLFFGVAGSSGTSLNNDTTAASTYAGMTFNSGASAFTLAGNSITLGNNIANNSTATQNINFDIALSGARSLTTTAGGGNISLGGAVSGSGFGLTASGAGTLSLVGNNTFTGSSTVSLGSTLYLNYATNNTSKLGSAGLTLTGGTIVFNGNSSAGTSQGSIGNLTLGSGQSIFNAISNNSGGLSTTFGTITRNAGGAIDFRASGSAVSINTSATNTSGTILGGWATYNGNDWATVSGGKIVQYTGYDIYNNVAGWIGAGKAGKDLTDDNGYDATYTNSIAVNSLRFNASASDSNLGVTGGQNLTVSSGGVLVTSNTGVKYQRIGFLNTGFVTGEGQGGLTSGTNELIINQNNPSSGHLEIYASIFGTGVGLVKNGPGFLDLKGLAATYSGATTINGGVLQLSGQTDTLPTSTSLTINSGTLILNGKSQTLSGLSGSSSGTIDNLTGSNVLTINNTTSSAFAGIIKSTAGNLTITKTGTGTLSLSGANTFSGTINLNSASTLSLSNSSAAGNSSNVLNVNSAGTINSSINDVTLSTLNISSDFTLSGSGASDGKGNRLRFSSPASTTMVVDLKGASRTITLGRRQSALAGNLAFGNQGSGFNASAGTFTIQSTGGAGTDRLIIAADSNASASDRAYFYIGNIAAFGTASQFNLGLQLKQNVVTAFGTSNIFGTTTNSLPNLTVDTGGIFDLSGQDVNLRSQTIATLTGAGSVLSGSTAGTLNSSVTLTINTAGSGATVSPDFSGSISDGTNANVKLSLAKQGAGLQVLSGTNTYTGATSITGGVLRANDGFGLPGTSSLTINGGVFETGANLTRSLGTNAGSIQITGGVSGLSAFGAPVAVNLGNASPTPLTITWGSTNFIPTTLVLNETTANNTLDFQNNLDLGGANRSVNVNAATATISGTVSGTGGLTKGGGGTLILTKANSYIGNTTISSGTLRVGQNNAIPTSSNVNIAAGTLDFDAKTQQVNSLVGGASSVIDNFSGTSALTVSNSTNDTFSGLIKNTTGTLSIAKSGSGSLTLSGTNSFSGGISVSAGSLTLSGVNSFGGGISVSGGAAIIPSSVTTNNFTGAVSVSGGTLTISSPATYAGGTTVGTGGVLVYGAVTTGSGTTSVASGPFGTGSVTLNNSSTLSNTANTPLSVPTLNILGNVQIGTTTSNRVQFQGAIDLGNAARIVTLMRTSPTGASGQTSFGMGSFIANGPSPSVNNGGLKFVRDPAGSNIAWVQFNGASTSFANASLTIGANVSTIMSVGTPFSGTASPALILDGGTLDLSNQASGGDSANARTVHVRSLSGIGTVTNDATLNVTPGVSTVVVNGSAPTDSASFDGVIQNGPNNYVGLSKTGSSVLKLTNSNTYSGPTNISGGELRINGPSGSTHSSSTINVATNGALGGTGIVNGPVSVTGTGVIAPGDGGVGQFTLNNTATLATGQAATIEVELGANTTPGVSFDQLVVSGALTLKDARLNVIAIAGAAPGSYKIISAPSYLPGVDNFFGKLNDQANAANAYTANGGFKYNVTYTSGDGVYIDIISVPEPSSLIAAASVLMLTQRRRRYQLK